MWKGKSLVTLSFCLLLARRIGTSPVGTGVRNSSKGKEISSASAYTQDLWSHHEIDQEVLHQPGDPWDMATWVPSPQEDIAGPSATALGEQQALSLSPDRVSEVFSLQVKYEGRVRICRKQWLMKMCLCTDEERRE